MTAENRIILERLTGRIEGLSFCIGNNEISGALIDIAETIDDVIKDESKEDFNYCSHCGAKMDGGKT